MLIVHALLAVLVAEISWLYVTGTLGITLLIIIAVYRPRA
jgi:hypothetical protein